MKFNHLDGEKEFHKWCESLQRKSVTLVTAGQSGAGKSTLVMNMLRMADNDADAPIAEQSPDSVTGIVTPFNGYVNGVDIMIVDVGLAAASDDEEKEIIAELIKVTEGHADMLLYCANMGPSGKLNDLDRKIVKLLMLVFTPEIWERATLVLTFGDDVKERNQKCGTTVKTPTVQMAMEKYAEAFEEILATSTAQVKVIPVLEDESAELRDKKKIAAVVSSKKPSEEVLPRMKWNTCLYKEVLKKCEREAVPSILKILQPVQKGATHGTIGGIIGGAVAGASIGFAAGGIGAAVGAFTGAIVSGVGGRKGVRTIYHKIAYNRYLQSDEGIRKRAKLL
jgi:GTP-binding protein EngB required for normal cell division